MFVFCGKVLCYPSLHPHGHCSGISAIFFCAQRLFFHKVQWHVPLTCGVWGSRDCTYIWGVTDSKAERTHAHPVQHPLHSSQAHPLSLIGTTKHSIVDQESWVRVLCDGLLVQTWMASEGKALTYLLFKFFIIRKNAPVRGPGCVFRNPGLSLGH